MQTDVCRIVGFLVYLSNLHDEPTRIIIDTSRYAVLSVLYILYDMWLFHLRTLRMPRARM